MQKVHITGRDNIMSELKKIEKEDALDILDRTIGFVNNCDSKTSIMLGIFGVLLTIIFSGDGVADLKNIFTTAISFGKLIDIIYCIILVCTVLGFIFGILKLFQVLFPKIEFDDLKQDDIELDSKIFFNCISKNVSYKEYKEKMMNYSEDEHLNDIISQIYSNSIICSRKFNNHKIGLVIASCSFLGFLIMWGIGIIVY